MTGARFGIAVDEAGGFPSLAERARWAEDAGFDILLIPDHLTTLNPEVGLMAAAAATTRLRIGTLVYNNDLRHPAVLAQQAATLDLLSGGRFELGIGAGWAVEEYRSAGIPMDRASVRIARMEEAVTVLRRLFAGETLTHEGEHYRLRDHRLVPEPPQGEALPIHVGGNGDKLLAAAARQADIVGVSPYSMGRTGPEPTHFGREALSERIAHVRRHRGDLPAPEINVPVQRVLVTDDREGELAALAERMADRWEAAPDATVLADSPYVLAGTPDEIAAQVRRWHEDPGIGFFSAWAEAAEGLAPVIANLRD